MRRLLVIGLLGCGLLATAKTLSPEEALQRVYGAGSEKAKAPNSSQMTVARTLTDRAGQATVYLFESESGSNSWMAVSANDLATPLLGYGDSAIAGEDLPPQMEWWLSQYSSQIAYADSMSRIPVAGTKLNRESTSASVNKAPTRSDYAPIASIMKTKWDQDNPYNKLCPKIGLKRAPTGCVATALSQIMKTHEYPEHGYGTGYAMAGSSSEELEMDLDIPLRWSDMKNTYTGSYTADQANAVAELMVAVGYGCYMHYNLDGSGAYDIDACRSLIENFAYAQTTWIYMRDYYSLEEWEDMLYAELEAGRPVYYSGHATDGGHAFVCDGYAGDGYFRFNWGWGGYYNGNFKIDALNPEGQGIGGFEGGYNSGQTAIMGIQPQFEGAVQPKPQLSCDQQPRISFNNNILTISGAWYNNNYKNVKFTIALEAENPDVPMTYYQEIGTYELAPYTGFNRFQVDMRSSSYLDGNYRLQLVTKTTDYPEWTECNGPVDVRKTVNCVRYDGQWIAATDIPLQITDASYPESIEIDVPSSYSLTIDNPNGVEMSASYDVFICKKENNSLVVVGDTDGEDVAEVTVPANSKITHTQEFTIRYFDENYENDKDLLLVLVDHEEMEVVYTFGNIRIGDEPQDIPVVSLSLDPTDITAVEGTEFQLIATVKPEDATNPTLQWTSSDESVAAVDQSGLVKVLAPGECVISAATTDGSDLKAECKVMAISSVSLLPADLTGVEVFTLDGVKVESSKLKTGIYVVNGRKIIIK